MSLRARLITPPLVEVSAAVGMLIVGTLVYLVDRSGQAYFIPPCLRTQGDVVHIFGRMGNQLPTFAHTFAFTLLTAAVLRPRSQIVGPICLVWFTIECLFELGQIEAVASPISAVLSELFRGVSILEATLNYLVAGTFDLLDLVSITFGSLLAYVLARSVSKTNAANAKSFE